MIVTDVPPLLGIEAGEILVIFGQEVTVIGIVEGQMLDRTERTGQVKEPVYLDASGKVLICDPANVAEQGYQMLPMRTMENIGAMQRL